MNQNPYRSLTLILVSAIASFLVVSNCGTRKRDRQNDRLDAIEKRLKEKEAAITPKKHIAAEPEDPAPKLGDVIQINMVEEAPDEIYRDMTVFSSSATSPGVGCRFTHLSEEIAVLEIRGRYALVQYERHSEPEKLAAWRQKWFYRTDPPFCADGDIGVMSFDDLERYRYDTEADANVRREQREELQRIRALFPELPVAPVEEP